LTTAYKKGPSCFFHKHQQKHPDTHTHTHKNTESVPMEHSKKRKITGDEKAACATIERFYINVVRKNSTWQVCRR
jgi:hypothetical protein